jgi:hypothetical protein
VKDRHDEGSIQGHLDIDHGQLLQAGVMSMPLALVDTGCANEVRGCHATVT